MMKFIKLPTRLVKTPCNTTPLYLDNGCIIEACRDNHVVCGDLTMLEHSILFIESGTLTLNSGRNEYTLNTGEMTILPKISRFKVSKTLNADGNFQGVFICLCKEFLHKFAQEENIDITKNPVDFHDIKVRKMNDEMLTYVKDISHMVDTHPLPGKVKLKFLELLYNLKLSYPDMLMRIFQLCKPDRAELENFMNENFIKPVSLEDLASMSGRSLSTFKREFKTCFGTTPKKWINDKRLELAYNLLLFGFYTVSDVCFMVGYDNPQYFSQLFRSKYKTQPNMIKKQALME
ncbi:MAG: AraC family transcriptional regulator [Bacteroidaceae bacterium]|nr:AraC family transcriptional regulator [Bacteroidaceae bacterium]